MLAGSGTSQCCGGGTTGGGGTTVAGGTNGGGTSGGGTTGGGGTGMIGTMGDTVGGVTTVSEAIGIGGKKPLAAVQ